MAKKRSNARMNGLLIIVILLLLAITYLFYNQITGLLNTPNTISSIQNQSIATLLISASDQNLSIYLSLVQAVLVIAGIVSGISVVSILGILSDKDFRNSVMVRANKYTALSIILLFMGVLGLILPLFSALNAVSALDYYVFYHYNTAPPNTYLNVTYWHELCRTFNQSALIKISNSSSVSCYGLNVTYGYVIRSYSKVSTSTNNAIFYLFFGGLFVLITIFLYVLFRLSYRELVSESKK